jgi:hypothetical protein
MLLRKVEKVGVVAVNIILTTQETDAVGRQRGFTAYNASQGSIIY